MWKSNYVTVQYIPDYVGIANTGIEIEKNIGAINCKMRATERILSKEADYGKR